jgi:hypothetical protein
MEGLRRGARFPERQQRCAPGRRALPASALGDHLPSVPESLLDPDRLRGRGQGLEPQPHQPGQPHLHPGFAHPVQAESDQGPVCRDHAEHLGEVAERRQRVGSERAGICAQAGHRHLPERRHRAESRLRPRDHATCLEQDHDPECDRRDGALAPRRHHGQPRARLGLARAVAELAGPVGRRPAGRAAARLRDAQHGEGHHPADRRQQRVVRLAGPRQRHRALDRFEQLRRGQHRCAAGRSSRRQQRQEHHLPGFANCVPGR